MNTKFDLGGYVLEITENGYLNAPDGRSGGCCDGSVGLQVIRHPLPSLEEETPPVSVLQTFVKPSQARAIASALLSAATEARG